MRKVKNAISNIAKKVASCNEENLHVLVDGVNIVRSIWMKTINIMKDCNRKDYYQQLLKEVKELYLKLRNKISSIYGLSGHYYYTDLT